MGGRQIEVSLAASRARGTLPPVKRPDVNINSINYLR